MASSVRAGASVDGGGGGGGKEPDPKRRRLLDAGGPIEDDETARQKMRDARVYEKGVDGTYGEYSGFDPDNLADAKSVSWYNAVAGDEIKPMGYFARKGDLPMMRWLYVNGADTRDEDVAFFIPMYIAAAYGRMEACKWLFKHGAAKDVNRRTREKISGNPNGYSPLSVTFGKDLGKNRSFSRWLILNGALCNDDDSGELNVELVKEDLGFYLYAEERKLLLEWANDLHRPRTSFLLFLSGALSAPQHAYSTRRSSPLKVLSGMSGVMELIGDYVGFVRGREARIVRQLTEMLPSLIQELDRN